MWAKLLGNNHEAGVAKRGLGRGRSWAACRLILSRTLGVLPPPPSLSKFRCLGPSPQHPLPSPSSFILIHEIAVRQEGVWISLSPSRQQWPLCLQPGGVLFWVLCIRHQPASQGSLGTWFMEGTVERVVGHGGWGIRHPWAQAEQALGMRVHCD